MSESTVPRKARLAPPSRAPTAITSRMSRVSMIGAMTRPATPATMKKTDVASETLVVENGCSSVMASR